MRKHRLTKLEINIILRMWANNCSRDVIAFRTGLPENSIYSCLYRHCGSGKEKNRNGAKNSIKNSIQNKENEIVKLFKLGYDIYNISMIEGITKPIIKKILIDNNLLQPDPTISFMIAYPNGVSLQDISHFRDCILDVGDSYRLNVVDRNPSGICSRIIWGTVDAKVIKKYKNFALTDKGCFQYIDFITGDKLKK